MRSRITDRGGGLEKDPIRRHTIHLTSVPTAGGGGGSRVMAVCASVLRSVADIVPDPALAEIQVHSFNWSTPIDPPRLFIDHGSFADASFWAYVAPRLRSSDTIVVSSTTCLLVAERFFMGEG